MKDGKIQWHPAFGAALQIELSDELDKVQIEEEHLLGKKPMQADFVVHKVDRDQEIRKNIGRLFRKHNIRYMDMPVSISQIHQRFWK